MHRQRLPGLIILQLIAIAFECSDHIFEPARNLILYVRRDFYQNCRAVASKGNPSAPQDFEFVAVHVKLDERNGSADPPRCPQLAEQRIQ